MQSTDTKRCSYCKLSLPLDDFGVNRSQKDGLMRQCRTCNNARASRYYREYKDEIRVRQADDRFRRHGITRAIFEKTHADQGGRCPICSRAFPALEMVADHDHAHCPGNWGCADCFRGVICSPCNRGIGIFEDDLERLSNAVTYLVSRRVLPPRIELGAPAV